MSDEKKWDMSKIINDPDLRFYFMVMPYGYGKRTAIKERMKKLQQKNKGEK